MRALFALRNIGGEDSVDALCAAFDSKSALLKHEIAYVLGQMQNNHAVPVLIERLSDDEEDLMVRHEAAEALGAIGELSSIPLLEKHLHHPMPEIAESCEVALDLFDHDPEPVISESCEVALDLLAWVQSKEFEYH